MKNNPSGYLETRFNAVKHGALSKVDVLPWENAKDLESIRRGFLEAYAPEGAIETYLVEELANLAFRKRRLFQAENAIIVQKFKHMESTDREKRETRLFLHGTQEEVDEESEEQKIAISYVPDHRMETLQRYEVAMSRSFERKMGMLLKLKEIRGQKQVVTQT